MKFPVRLKRLLDGRHQARSIGSIAGDVTVTGDTREQALEKIRAELHYRVEWCPCTGVTEEFIELEVRDEPSSPGRASVF